MADPDKSAPAPQQHHAVMVSSTYNDLKEFRQILIDAAHKAGLYTEVMEHDAALPALDVIDSSLLKVERAAAYVLLIGQRYGQQPDCAERNPNGLSITELEYNKAIECKRPVLVFMLSGKFPLAADHMDRTEALVAKLEAFRARAKSKDGSGKGVHRVYKAVNSEAELLEAATGSMRDLARHLEERPIRSMSDAPQTVSAAEISLPSPPTPYTVPAYIGSHEFVGRTAELALLDDWSAAEDSHAMLLFDAIGGSGKSMLTWHWFEKGAATKRDWAGRFWYSFYENGASMALFCRHALAYITRRPPGDFDRKSTRELAHDLVAHLRKRPWLLVLDGLERVLVAYHRSDAATVTDESLNTPTDQMAERNPCTAAHPDDDELLRQLSNAGPSKVLVSSRLMPQTLLNQASQPIPGVKREHLRGLRPEDAVHLLQRCGVGGNVAAMQRFVHANCDGHPLVVGALAGLIVDPVLATGDFDAWVKDPAGGAALDLGTLDLVQRRSHILHAAIAAVPGQGRELLATLAMVHGGIDREALEALNPHRPEEPEAVEAPQKPEAHWRWEHSNEEEKAELREQYARDQAEHAAYLEARASWRASPELKAAPTALSRTLRDLQRRGLVQAGDGGEPRYDLHPVVRGIVSAGLAEDATERLGQRVVDHFQRRAHNPYEQAQTLQELEGGFHIVRTLLRMGRFEQAMAAWRGDLANAVYFNVLAWHEMLALLKPFFPGGWLQPPHGVDDDGASYLMSNAGWALHETGLREQALQVQGASIRLNAVRRDAIELWVGLCNLANAFQAAGRLADALVCRELELRLGEAPSGEQAVFMSRLNAFVSMSQVGDWPRAEALWASLDGMGRDWNRAVYRPGAAERWRARNLWWQGHSPAEPLAEAERLARGAKARAGLRDALDLRGQWRLAEGDAAAAVEAFAESAQLARANGSTDLHTECWLALARWQAGALADPCAEAERLQSAGAIGYALARLWQAAGDLAQARQQAVDEYRWAWADGEPYVFRFDLDLARRLLADCANPNPSCRPTTRPAASALTGRTRWRRRLLSLRRRKPSETPRRPAADGAPLAISRHLSHPPSVPLQFPRAIAPIDQATFGWLLFLLWRSERRMQDCDADAQPGPAQGGLQAQRTRRCQGGSS